MHKASKLTKSATTKQEQSNHVAAETSDYVPLPMVNAASATNASSSSAEGMMVMTSYVMTEPKVYKTVVSNRGIVQNPTGNTT